MDKDTRFALLVIGLPFLGLIYCLIIIGFMMVSPIAQNHPVMTGLVFSFIPLSIAGYFWISASAKAYKK
jgi:hypothetical protein